MFIYIHTLSYYKLFIYFNLCLIIMINNLSCLFTSISKGPSWLWSYSSWIYNYLCNQCHHHWCCKFKSRSGRGVLDTLYDNIYQWVATGLWFSPGLSVSSTNKTDCHDITEILLKVALNTIKQTSISFLTICFIFYISD